MNLKSQKGQGFNHNKSKKRNKKLSLKKYLDATEQIVRRDGISALTLTKVAKQAGRSRRMLYDYFGNIEGLKAAFLKEYDSWLHYEKIMDEVILNHSHDHGRELGSKLLKTHFINFLNDHLQQEIALNELNSKDNLILKELSESRELLGDKLFSISDEYFKNSKVNIRVINALLLGGLNYIVLHGKATQSSFCGLDIDNQTDQCAILNMIDLITNWAYDTAKFNDK